MIILCQNILATDLNVIGILLSRVDDLLRINAIAPDNLSDYNRLKLQRVDTYSQFTIIKRKIEW